jgi:hypothetical protein
MKRLELPALQSTSFWQPVKAVQKQRHWLTDPSGSAQSASAQTWVPRAHASQNNISGSMSTVSVPVDLPSAPEMFVHVKGGHVKQSPSRPAAPQPLNTNALFSKNYTKSPDTHWLRKTSAAGSAVEHSTTLIAPLAKQSANTENMWNRAPAFDPSSVSLFSNPHTQPWNRKNRGSESLKNIESTEMWRRSYDLPSSPRNWLLNKKVSKVEFRY